ncbi:MAG: amino acid adenylation domain-containing protein [Alcanivoracaceae bacterium]|nr:amino acid adenylation domain-containing protein [Alcanivoracaceae bacterium]
MREIVKIIAQLADAGIEVYLFEEKLKARALKGVFAAEFVNLIKNNKPGIIEYLSQQAERQQFSERPKIVRIERKNKQLIPSYAQQRLWFIDNMDGSSAHYNMPSAMRLQGDFNVDVAGAAFTQIIERHETLRTTFVNNEDSLSQIVHEQFEFTITVIDLSSLTSDEQKQKIKILKQQDAQFCFDLKHDLMLRVSYLKIANNQGILLFNMHHIASDGWSISVLVNEFIKLYCSMLEDKPNPLVPLEIQYADYAHWQRNWLSGEVLENQLTYWDKQLVDLPQAHNLPLDFERPALRTFNGALHHFGVNDETLTRLKSIALENKVTLFMLIHAAFSILLCRYANSADIVIGTPVANRLQKELEGLIGFFVNTLILRTDCSDNPKFNEYLQQVKTINLDAQANQDVPFEHLVDRLNPNRSTSHNALFQIMFSMNTNDKFEFKLPNVEIQSENRSQVNAKFDLTLNADPEQEGADTGLHCSFEYNTDLFKAKTIKNLADCMQRLLIGIASSDNQAIAELPLLSDTETDYLLYRLNNTQAHYPSEQCIQQLFEQQVKKTPHNVAVVFEKQSLTYAELNKQANQLAHYLIDCDENNDIAPDHFVGLCFERSAQMIVAILAVLKTGAAYLPLDPAYPKSRLQYMIQDSGLSTVITQQVLQDVSKKQGIRQLLLDSNTVKNTLLTYSTANLIIKTLNSNHLAYVIYTSGSTGQPKGVMVEHQNSVHSVYARKHFYKHPVKSFLLISPIAFDSSLAGITWTLLFGGKLVIPNSSTITDPDALIRLIDRRTVSHTLMTPALYSTLLSTIQSEDIVQLHTVIVAGESFTETLLNNHQKLLPKTKLFNEYGPTETTVWATAAQLYPDNNNQAISIGKAINNTRLFVLNSDKKLVPKGSTGELYISGSGLARGYLNQAELTAERFIRNPFSQEENDYIYQTGDMVRYLEDDNLEFIGRIDDQVKIRGFRIELGEIEQQILNHPNVESALVIINQKNADDKKLVAYFTSESIMEESELTHSILSLLHKYLPDYMLPTFFIRLPHFPLTVNGKIDREALPEPSTLDLNDDYVAPTGEIEKQLTEIWSTILKIPQEKISTNAHFFKLGGHSLLSIKLVAAIRSRFSCELSVRVVFDAPQLSELAKRIKNSHATTRPKVTKIPRINHLFTPSYAQQRLWFIDQMDGGSAHYNMPSAMRLHGDFKVEVAQAAFADIIRRHEVLRTVFINSEQGPLQLIREQFDFNIKQIDLSHLSSDLQEQAIYKAIKGDANQSFNLSDDLMLRVTYLYLSVDKGVMLFNMHHIASDGWSIGILVDEFAQLYRSKLAGKPNPLTALAIQYADYAHWQQHWLEGEVFESQLNYWDRQLADLPQVHNLPLKDKRPVTQTFQGESYRFILDVDTLESLKLIALDNQITLFMLLHAAFSTLLSRYANSTDIVIGTPVANRLQKELESVIGFFVNTLVLRADCSNNPYFVDFLQQIKNINLDAQSNQDVPFEHLVDRLNPARSTSHSALFQILFNMDTNEDITLKLPNVSLSPGHTQQRKQINTKFELTLSAVESTQGLAFNFKYNSDLFEASFIKQLSASLQLLLQGIVTNPNRRLAEFEILDSDQQHYLLHTLNDTQLDYHRDQCIHQLFETQVSSSPDETALVFEEQQLSYQQLNEQANQLAHYLIDKGVKPETIVGLYAQRSVNMIVAILAILKTGAAYLPLDPNQPDNRLNYMLKDSQIAYLLSNLATDQLTIKDIQVISLGDVVNNKGLTFVHNPNITTKTSQLAYIIYTSGSTGQPKGVMVEHGNVLAYHASLLCQWQLLNGDNISAWLWTASYAFDASVKGLLSLCAGRGLVMPSESQAKRPEVIVALIQKHQIGIYNASPHLMELTLEYLEMGRTGTDKLHFPDLILGGEDIPQAILAKVLKYCKKHQRQALNAYGPTETTINSTFDLITETLTIGRPIANTQTYVLNHDAQLQPFGTVGELYIGGAGLSRGYLHHQDLTAERFIKHPFIKNPKNQAARLYKTGDLVRYAADGRLIFMGRADEQVKIRGFRIELGEIEQQLSLIDYISAALVMLTGNKASQQLTAYIVLGDVNIESKEYINKIRQELAAHLPDYMLPSALILLDSLPLTANGKIDKNNLPLPDESLKNEYIAPYGATEEGLCAIWSELLKIPINTISTASNFFELGGHSLLSIRLVAQIRSRFNKEIAIHDIFESSQLSVLAEVISHSQLVARPRVTVLQRQDHDLICSFAQQRLWFIDQMEEGSSHYNMPAAVRLHGDFKVAVAQRAFAQIINRHETLRTNFIDGDTGPLQVIHQQIEFCMTQIDLSQQTGQQQEQAITAAIEEDAKRPFNLRKDLMLRASYLHISDGKGVLLFNMHHIASDGWSMGILINEFVKLYQANLEGKPEPLTPFSIQYADYAHWQRNWLKGQVLESQLAYWDRQLTDLPQVHNLPLDFERPAYQTYNGASYPFKVDGNNLQRLESIALENQVTLFMLLHAAFSILLSRYSNNTDIVIGTPVANRLQKELEGLIGFFVNTLVLRTDCSGHPSFTDFLQQVKTTNLNAQANQDVPFEHLVDRLNPSRNPSHNALFQIMLSMNTGESFEMSLPNVRLSPQPSSQVTAKFDLVMNAVAVNENSGDKEKGLYCSFTYNTDLFTAETIARLAKSMQLLLASIAADATQSIAQLPLLGDAETHYLLHTLNDTQVDYPDQMCVHQLFAQQVEKSPDHIAVAYEEQSLTYFELNAKANQLAHYLIEQGIKADDFIGLCFERSLDMMVALLAILKAGAAYLPLDPSYPKDRLDYMMNDSALSLVLTQQHLIASTSGQQRRQLTLDDKAFNNVLNNYPSSNPTIEDMSSDDLAYTIYTSGSTGKPKGVINTHSALNNLCQWHINEYDITTETRASHLASIGFDAAVWEIWPYLLSGAQILLISDQIRLSPHKLLQYFKQSKITHCFLPTALLEASFDLLDTPEKTSLEFILTGGEKLTRHNFTNSSTHLVNHYGPTESTVVTTSCKVMTNENIAPPIGKPIANIRTYVLTNERSLTPNKVIGELYIAGAGLARGYLNQPELTAENFIQHTFSDNSTERLYRTGDLVRYLQDGNLEFMGRIDHQVKIRGFRIELGEIEYHLSELEQVRSCAVLVEDNHNEEKYLSAYITLNDKHIADSHIIKTIKIALKSTMPAYMIPSFITV